MREQGCKPCPFVARLSPTGGLQAAPTIGRKLARVSPDCLMIAVLRVVRIFRGFVGRGLDPAAGTPRQARRSRRTARFTIGCRGGLQAARGAFPQPGTLRAMKTPCGRSPPPPAPKIPLLWFGGQRTTIYRVPKRAGKNLSKKSKKGVDKGKPGWYYSQAVRRGSAGRQAGKPHRYSLERVSGAKSSRKKFKKISKKFLTNEQT